MRHVKMPSINLSQLRDTKRLKAWLRAGKTVELRDRNRVIARIIPAFSEGSGQGDLELSKSGRRSWRKRRG
jgi:antitoxin (DNA-binding transcriptional repressor) of toxin-antitoxin stability system